MTGVAVIGAGYWGKNLVRNLHELGVLRSVADPDVGARERIGETYAGVDVTANASDVLTRADVDAVAIATPAVTHGQLVDAALAAGKHVLVEKPLCLDVEEGRRLRREADTRGLTLMVGHVLLYHPGFRKLLELTRSGELGNLRYIYSNRLSLGKIRREENALWSFAPHDISMILQLAGELPTEVTASGGQYLTEGVQDTTLTHMVFATDLRAHIFVSWLHPYKDQRLVAVGDRAMAVFDDVQPLDHKLVVYEHDVGWEGDIPVITKAEGRSVEFEAGEPLRLECEAFIRAVETGEPPHSDATEGIRVLQVLDASQRSLASGRPIGLER